MAKKAKKEKRPVAKIDFRPYGAAIKDSRKNQNESRNKVGDELYLSPRYLANIENKGQQPSLQVFLELMSRYHISVDQILYGEAETEKSTNRRQLDTLVDDLTDTEIKILIATAQVILDARAEDERSCAEQKLLFEIVVLAEGKTRNEVTVASTASEYPLVNFQLVGVRVAGGDLSMPLALRSTDRADRRDIPNPYEKGRWRMANRKRNIQMKFYVTEEEKRLIDEKMKLLPTQRHGAYLRKMAIDGYIIYTDTADIKAFTKELSTIGRNINQIAKRINAGGPAYQADMEEIRERLEEIWQLQRRILSSQR